MKLRDTMSPEVLDHAIEGLNLPGGTLRHAIGGDRTLLLFLRHLG